MGFFILFVATIISITLNLLVLRSYSYTWKIHESGWPIKDWQHIFEERMDGETTDMSVKKRSKLSSYSLKPDSTTYSASSNWSSTYSTTYKYTSMSRPQQNTEVAPRTPRIPLIFHQIYRDTTLPAPYGICLYSLLLNHRFRDGRQSRNQSDQSAHRDEFDYYFWTDQSIKDYREDRTSFNLSSNHLQKEFEYFKSAREMVEVTDMVRYFFLYEYGGIYVDFDMEPVKSFLSLLERGYPCILSEENPIQVKTIGSRPGLSIALLASQIWLFDQKFLAL